MAPITPITGISLPSAAPALDGRSSGGGFQDVFAAAVRGVESTGKEAAASVEQFLSGEGGELHSVVLATQRAELAFDLMLQMRNKVVNAYQEIMRMQM
jgi:flagellar hook-basal body complex protein FliE